MIDLIIPVLNEKSAIAPMEEQLRRWKGQVNVCFCDGGSQDGTFEAIQFPKLKTAPGRAQQMNAGAVQGNADFIWFLHVDAEVPEEAPAEIETAMDSGAEWGGFPIQFSPTSWSLRRIQAFSNRRAKYRHMVFGDQGIFVRRTCWIEQGGFREMPFMEDLDWSLRMKALGIKPVMLKSTLTVSSRRFLAHGTWPMACMMKKVQWQYRWGKDIHQLAKEYRDFGKKHYRSYS